MQRNSYRWLPALGAAAAVAALAACGVETASTAATAAAVKQQEIEQGKKTMESVKQNLDQSLQQVQSSAQRADAEK